MELTSKSKPHRLASIAEPHYPVLTAMGEDISIVWTYSQSACVRHTSPVRTGSGLLMYLI